MPDVDGTHLDFILGFSKSLVQLAVTRYDVVVQHYPSEIAFASIYLVGVATAILELNQIKVAINSCCD